MPNLSFLKKELQEFAKTSKGFIILGLFVFFAISSPILAKYMNELLLAIASDIPIVLPEPRLQDAWLQFYKNVSTIFIVYIIIMTGSVSQEKNKGSIILVLTKRVTRLNFVLSKFFAGIIVFTTLYLLAVVLGACYTNVLFESYWYDGLGISLFIFWLMGVFFTALAILASVIGKTPTASALMGFFGFAVLQILSISTNIAMVNPAGASTLVNAVLAGTVAPSDLWIHIAVTSLCTVVMLGSSYLIFRKQEI